MVIGIHPGSNISGSEGTSSIKVQQPEGKEVWETAVSKGLCQATAVSPTNQTMGSPFLEY